MKKSLLALMLAIALVSLTACGSKVKEPEATATPVVTEAPTAEPTEEPTAEPTEAPTAVPTEAPTAVPTEAPTAEPTAVPTEAPTAVPTEAPTEAPTAEMTAEPVVEATAMPTAEAEADAQSDEAAAAVVISETTEAPADEEAALTLSDDVLASAYNGAVTVLKSEIQEEYDQMLSQYVAYYAQYGYSVDEYDTELQASVAQETVQTKLSTSIVRHYAAQNGYELTEEKKTELAAQVKTALDNTREYLESYLSASGFTGDELNAAVEEQMAQAGYTEETLMDSAELNDVLNFLYERATADVTVTEDEVKAAFDEKVAKQKESYASVDAFVNDYVNESEILYTPENVRLMDARFEEIASVFSAGGVEDFMRLPESVEACRKFAKLFVELNDFLESAKVQGFTWEQQEYSVTHDDGSVEVVRPKLDERTYLILVQRYKEMFSSGEGSGSGPEAPYELDGHITEIDTGLIDTDYMNANFTKWLKALGGGDPALLASAEEELHKSFASLSQEEQRYAELFMHDVERGEIELEEGKTLRDYITYYANSAKNSQVEQITKAFDVDGALLNEMMRLDLTETTLNEFGRFDRLKASVNRSLAKAFFDKPDSPVSQFTANLLATKLLKSFILEGGFDLDDRK